MFRFVIRRLAKSLLLIFGVTFLIFFVINIATDNFFDQGGLNSSLYPFEVAKYRANSGFAETIAVRYKDWILHVFQGNFGVSNQRPEATVLSVILFHLPKSGLLVVGALILSILISIPLGLILAVWSGRRFIRWLELVISMGIGVPSFIPAIIVIYLFSIILDWLPFNGVYVGNPLVWYKQIWVEVKYMILPILGLTFGISCTLISFLRTSMLGVLHEDYIRTARAKGVHELRVVFKHALKNALIPWLNTLGMAVPILFSELFIVERIFSWPGITTQMIEGLGRYDYPLILGIAIILCLILVIINLVVDLLHGLVNPQIRYAWGDE